jgi:undecaprenyl diphosphate synthase
MRLLRQFLKSELAEMMENGIHLRAIDEIERLPDSVLTALHESMEKTRENRGMLLNLALSYGGRDEIVRAAQKVATQVKGGQLRPEEITKALFSTHLYTWGIPDPDLLIRTSGEMRLSNFLLWQLAYSEIFVTQTLWPDFRRQELIQILRAFQERERRFGMTGEQIRQGFSNPG